MRFNDPLTKSFLSVCFVSVSPLCLPANFLPPPPSFPLFPRWLLPPFPPRPYNSFSNFFPMPQYPLFPPPPLHRRERPVVVVAPAEARLPVTAGGGRRAREHHNIWWRGRGRGRHRGLWHRSAPERPPQLTFPRLSNPGQQEHVSGQTETQHRRFFLHLMIHLILVKLCLASSQAFKEAWKRKNPALQSKSPILNWSMNVPDQAVTPRS